MCPCCELTVLRSTRFPDASYAVTRAEPAASADRSSRAVTGVALRGRARRDGEQCRGLGAHVRGGDGDHAVVVEGGDQ